MNPECWGPKYWNVLFDCAYWFDKQRNADARPIVRQLFGVVLGESLPCSICRDNYTRILTSSPSSSSLPSLDTAVAAFQVFPWLYTLKKRTLARDDDNDRPAAAAGPSLAVITARHDTVQSGVSSVDDVIFIVYATVLEQFTRGDGDGDGDDDEQFTRDDGGPHAFLATLLACCALVPALSSFVQKSGPSIVAGGMPNGGLNNNSNCQKMKRWLHALVNLFERTSGRDAEDIVYTFFALCSVSTRRRALHFLARA